MILLDIFTRLLVFGGLVYGIVATYKEFKEERKNK